MKRTNLCRAGLIAVFLSLGQARGQGVAEPMPESLPLPRTETPLPSETIDMQPNPADPIPAGPLPGSPLTLSSWILRPRSPGCCGPVGGNGPIDTEIYLRSGLQFPIGGGFMNNVLDVGWTIEGGARVLFFNVEQDAAWVVDMGLTNTNNNARDKTTTVPLFNFPIKTSSGSSTLPEFSVSVSSLNRTCVGLSAGREWYLTGNARCDDPRQMTWRVGVDAGGRWGTSKVDTVQTHHFTDTIGEVYVAAHTDVEVPCGCHGAVLTFGARIEWSYTFQDILQDNYTDVEELGVLFTAGLRY
jgi:hypothetical protein